MAKIPPQLIRELIFSNVDDKADFRLPRWLKREVKKQAQLKGWSLSQYLLSATLEYVERNKK